MIYQRLAIILLFVALSGVANAVPSITSVTGQAGNGQPITISGSGFGANGPNVVVFDDFEGGILGQNIATGAGSATVGVWGSRDTSGSSYYGNQAAVSGSLAFETDYSVHFSNYIQADLPANTRALFASWWLYLPAGDNYPGEGGSGINWKQMWVQGSSTVDDDLVLPTRHSESTWQINGNDQDPGYSNYTTVDFTKGQWKRLAVWLKGSTTSTSADGEVKFWDLTSSGMVQREEDLVANTLKESGVWERVRPNGYGRQTSNCITSFDDIYIASGANAQARIEFGNASTYAASTNITVATPSSWSDTSISATFYTGSFQPEQQAYVYVFDSTGTANATGYGPVTIQADGPPDTTAPSCSTFTLPGTSSTLSVTVSELTCSDAVGVSGYYLSESSATPTTGNTWISLPSSFSVSGQGERTVYVWARDAAGNISTPLNATVTVTLAGSVQFTNRAGKSSTFTQGSGQVRFTQ